MYKRQDYAKGVLTRVESLIALARSAGIPVLVDPKGDDYSRYRGATLVTPNRSEMQQAVGRWNSESEPVSYTHLDVYKRQGKELRERVDLVGGNDEDAQSSGSSEPMPSMASMHAMH